MNGAVGKFKWEELPAQTKRSILITCGLALAAVAVYFLLVSPALAGKAKADAALADVQGEFDTLYQNIGMVSRLRKTTEEMEVRLEEMNSNGVLVPLANSLDMRAMSIISPIADRCGVAINVGSVRSQPVQPIKGRIPATGRVYSRQPVEFVGYGSYAQITAFVQDLESSLPMASVAALHVAGRAEDPEVHAMAITIEWPVETERPAVDKKVGGG